MTRFSYELILFFPEDFGLKLRIIWRKPHAAKVVTLYKLKLNNAMVNVPHKAAQ